ncbi:MAG TPA: sigma 54 modulation/S30EA ribosomal C-terminal domain-containing protein [Thermoanaerobaculia bacterium]|jgi:predicted RNA-binding protein Jag
MHPGEWTPSVDAAHNAVMPTGMSVFAELAARYGVDPHDEEAVDRFFEDTAPALPPNEREQILSDLLGAEGAGESPRRKRYAHGAPAELNGERTPMPVPLDAVHPKHDAEELKKIAAALKDCISSFLTLAKLDIIIDVQSDEQGQLEIRLKGSHARRLETEKQEILRAIKLLTADIVAAQPLVESVHMVVGGRHSAQPPAALNSRRLDISVKIKEMTNIVVETMTVNEAAVTLASSNGSFLTFRNSETGGVCVVYRRDDPDAAIGLIPT